MDLAGDSETGPLVGLWASRAWRLGPSRAWRWGPSCFPGCFFQESLHWMPWSGRNCQVSLFEEARYFQELFEFELLLPCMILAQAEDQWSVDEMSSEELEVVGPD